MSLIYVTSMITLISLFMLLKKTENKVDFLKTIVINMVLVLCYNVVICYINHWLNIKCNLLNLSIENLIISILLFVSILRAKQVQKYERICKKDIIFIIIITIVIGILAYIYFGFPIKLKYFMTDAANHYSYARFFYENSELMSTGIKPRSVYKCWYTI